MFLSPSKETELQSTGQVLLGGGFSSGRRSRARPRDDDDNDDDDVCVCVYTRVITKGVTGPSELSSPSPTPPPSSKQLPLAGH